jgi:hypothetical protein
MGVPSVTSPYFLIEHAVPPLMLWAEDQRLHFHRSEICRVHWSYRDEGGGGGGTHLRQQHASHPYEQFASDDSSSTSQSYMSQEWGGERGGGGVGELSRISVKSGVGAGGDGSNMAESYVKLYLCTGLLQWRVLADNLPTSGSFEWKIPDNCAQGTYLIQAKLKGSESNLTIITRT